MVSVERNKSFVLCDMIGYQKQNSADNIIPDDFFFGQLVVMAMKAGGGNSMIERRQGGQFCGYECRINAVFKMPGKTCITNDDQAICVRFFAWTNGKFGTALTGIKGNGSRIIENIFNLGMAQKLRQNFSVNVFFSNQTNGQKI